MSLNYELGDIKDWKEVCFKRREDEEWMNPVTESLIWATMSVGINTIKESNVEEFYFRIKALELVSGAFMSMRGEGDKLENRYFTFEEIKAHIGLSTNASRKTHAEFMNDIKRMVQSAIERRISGEKAMASSKSQEEAQ